MQASAQRDAALVANVVVEQSDIQHVIVHHTRLTAATCCAPRCRSMPCILSGQLCCETTCRDERVSWHARTPVSATPSCCAPRQHAASCIPELLSCCHPTYKSMRRIPVCTRVAATSCCVPRRHTLPRTPQGQCSVSSNCCIRQIIYVYSRIGPSDGTHKD